MPQQQVTPEQIDRQFEIAVLRLADDLRYGSDLSPYSGAGVDYRQSRPFVDGDPVKDIDWRVTARTGRFHLKEYEGLKTTPVYLLVDTSASMAVSSGPLNKLTLAALVAGGLGMAALRRLSPVGVLAGGQRQMHFRPSLQRARVFQWAHEIRLGRRSEQTRVATRLTELQSLLMANSLVIVISDLYDPEAVNVIKRVAQRHDCIVLQLQDPAERGRLRGGMIRGREAETGRAFVAHGRSRWFDEGWQPDKALKRAGIDYLLLGTDRPFVAPLRRFLAARGGLVRNAR